MDDDFLREVYYFVDSAKMNKIFVKFKHIQNSSELEEFVIIYLTKIDEVFVEVVKYDFSKREKFHVHYYSDQRKVYFDEIPTNETMARLNQHLLENWHKYLLKFLER